jgi:hypothetical protein
METRHLYWIHRPLICGAYTEEGLGWLFGISSMPSLPTPHHLLIYNSVIELTIPVQYSGRWEELCTNVFE